MPLRMKKARSTSASDTQTFEKTSMQQNTFLLLKGMIEQGRIRPGEKLLEVQVAKAFGISRSPARHALRALCDARMVREADGRGFQVAGRPKASDIGQIASLEKMQILPLPQWERIYKKVEQELCIRVLLGSVRIVEASLAEYFGVSRTVARDVLARMHSVGMVGKDGVGRWVAKRISADTIRDLFELRCILEPEALLRAAPLVPEAELELMHANIARAIANGAVEMGAVGQLETELHITLLAYCRNREIINSLAKTHLLFVPSLYLLDSTLSVPRNPMNEALQEHLEILEALHRGNDRKAAELLRDHLGEATNRWLRRFEVFAKTDQSLMPSYMTSLKD
jgi:DNA-binding GntR family transcriptional regulator